MIYIYIYISTIKPGARSDAEVVARGGLEAVLMVVSQVISQAGPSASPAARRTGSGAVPSTGYELMT